MLTVAEWKRACQLLPPVFYKWFITTFPESSHWFRTRQAYARTAAVMSIVGYIVGYVPHLESNPAHLCSPSAPLTFVAVNLC